MKLLISFCNQIGPEKLEPWLVEYDAELEALQPLLSPSFDVIKGLPFQKATGCTGLCKLPDGRLAALTQSTPTVLFIFRRIPGFDRLMTKYVIEKTHILAHVKDAHSISPANDTWVIICSTGNDSLVGVDTETGQEKVVLRATWKDEDTIHLNSVHHTRSDNGSASQTLLSVFNYCPALCKDNRPSGAIVEYDAHKEDKVIWSPLSQPHSLCYYNGLTVVESGANRVLRHHGKDVSVLDIARPGYLRGLAVSQHYTCIGVSDRRLISRSTGEPNKHESGKRNKCGVIIYKNQGVRLNQCAFQDFISLSGFGSEIYDLLPTG